MSIFSNMRLNFTNTTQTFINKTLIVATFLQLSPFFTITNLSFTNKTLISPLFTKFDCNMMYDV